MGRAELMGASGWVWVTPLLAFGGALLGSGLSYLAAQQGTRQRESQGRREEWGRRFTGALGYLAVPDPHGRALGRVVLARMARSELAGVEERELADAVLLAEVRYGAGGVDVEAATEGESLDEIDFMEDDDGIEFVRDDEGEDSEGGQP